MRDAPRPRKRQSVNAAWMSDDPEWDPYVSRHRMPSSREPELDDQHPSTPRTHLPPMPERRQSAPDMSDSARRRAPLAGTSARMRAVHRPAPRQYDDQPFDEADERDSWRTASRLRMRSAARPLDMSVRVSDWSDESPVRTTRQLAVPDIAAYHPRPVARVRVHTRAIAETARSPWTLLRMMLVLSAVMFAMITSFVTSHEASQPLMSAWHSAAGAHDAQVIAALVRAETQGKRPDLYDSVGQFNDWWDAACSAAVMSEILTAWGAPHATIGKMIDVMQPDISLNGGLLRPQGFQRGAAAFGYRADLNWHLTYNQMRYITDTLGLPIIVNVRISYGYYHFFSTGHFLVMTGGDDQGLTIVDSSEYYIKYLSRATFNSMFTGMTAVIVPKDYTYTLPAA